MSPERTRFAHIPYFAQNSVQAVCVRHRLLLLFFLSPCIAFPPLWGVTGSWFLVCHPKLFSLIRFYFLWQEIISFDKKFIPFKEISFDKKLFPWNYFHCQEIISFGSRLFSLAGNYFLSKIWFPFREINLTRNHFHLSWKYFLWQEIIPLAGNYFKWQEIISNGRKLFRMAGNYLIWQKIISFDRKLFPLAENYIL